MVVRTVYEPLDVTPKRTSKPAILKSDAKWSNQHKKVIYFTKEMSVEDLESRILELTKLAKEKQLFVITAKQKNKKTYLK